MRAWRRDSLFLVGLALLFLFCPPAWAQAEPVEENASESVTTTDAPLPPVPTTLEAEDTSRFRRHLDFFGMNLGGGV